MPTPPNVLMITTDQQRRDSLGCYGSDFVKTPNLDALAADGVVVHRAYCPNPVCTPSRVSLHSGQRVSRHGVWNHGVTAPEEITFLSHLLGAAGYRTGLIGKAHFQPYGADGFESWGADRWPEEYGDFHGPYYGFEYVEVAPGHTLGGLRGHYGMWAEEKAREAGQELEQLRTFTRRAERGFGADAVDWDLPTELHNSVWTAERTLALLDDWSEEPFFLSVNFQDPHHPHAVPRDWEHRVDPAAVPLPIPFDAEQAEGIPPQALAHLGELDDSRFRGAYPVGGQGRNPGYRGIPERDVREARAYYYTMVQLIDACVGRIVDGLVDRGLAENTLILFTTDHGELLGDHGIWMKGPFLFEPLIRIPLIMKWPAAIEGGRRYDGLVSLTDVVPTVLAAAGCEPAEPVDGYNLLLGLRNGESTAGRDAVLVECRDDPDGLRLRTLVTDRYKLTHYHGEDFGELYDLADDPHEQQNLWGRSEYRELELQLLRRLTDAAEAWGPEQDRQCYA